MQAAELLRSVLEMLPAPVVVSSFRDGAVLYANERAAGAFGIPLAELIGFPAPDIYVDPAARAAILAILEREGALEGHEVELRGPDGTTFWALASSARLDYEGDPALCTTFVDISARQREVRTRTEQLAEAERRLATLLRTMPGVAYRCRNDAHWTMELISDGCRELTGYAPDELIDNRAIAFDELIEPDDRSKVRAAVDAALAAREPFQIEYRLRARDGAVKWAWEQGAGVFGDRGALVAIEGIIHDVTRRRSAELQHEHMQDQMRAAQRMEAIGRLAGGVAHDFNNLLTVIQSYAGFLRAAFADGDPVLEDLDAIEQAAARAAALTSQLLAFSRRQVQELHVVDLNAVVTDIDRLLMRVLGEDIDCVKKLAPGLGRVRVDPTQIEQVLMNLAVNARDAMPDGGTLIMETANVELDRAYADGKRAPVEPGSYVMIAVSDTGSGMDEDTQAKVFEPFFTTKTMDRGTGLGLSTVYGIVKQSGGYIWVYSELGVGTTFKIYLPRVDAEVSDSGPGPRAAGDLGGGETILLVEDETAVRMAASRILRRSGYEVLEAVHGVDALRVAEDHGGAIDLMLTDVVMPRLGGRELASQLGALRPDMKIVFMSGYTADTAAHQGLVDDGAALLNKPFTPETLLRKVRDALDG